MVYALVAGGALALVNIQTKPLIEENRRLAEEKARATVLPDMATYEEKNAGEFSYWVGYKDDAKNTIGGYIFQVAGVGYSSTIEAMVGIDEEGFITGVRVLSQQETPGLGARLEEVKYGESEPWFTRQYEDMSVTDEITVDKDGGSIDSITGATISSRALTNAVNKGLREIAAAAGLEE